jgi:hypothetical protein
MVLTAQAQETFKVTLKAVSKEGQFTLEVERVFRPYLSWDCSGVTEKLYMVLRANVLQGVQVRLSSFRNEGHFTLQGQTVFRPYLT